VRVLMMAVYDMSLPVSAFIAVIIDFPDDILWILRPEHKQQALLSVERVIGLLDA
jgi:hypothetical protein